MMAQNANAKKPVTVSFHVDGNCGRCKDRIEGALQTKGVKRATWDSKSQMATVTYVPAVISEDKLHQIVANVGHSTEKSKAKQETIEALPFCCQPGHGHGHSH